MAYVLPIIVNDSRWEPNSRYAVHFQEVVQSFADGGVLSTDLVKGATGAIDASNIAKPGWDNESKSKRFLHGEKLSTSTLKSAAPVAYPGSRAGFERRATWYAQRFRWAIIAWSTSFQTHTAALVTESSELAERFEQVWRRHPCTSTWDRQRVDPLANVLLGVRRIDVAEQSFRIALISECEHEGDAVWESCDCECRRPFLYARESWFASSPETLVDWPRLGFRVVGSPAGAESNGIKEVSTVVQPRSRETLSDFLRECDGEETDVYREAATNSDWVLFRGDLDRLPPLAERGRHGSLEGMAHLIESVEWAYTRHHGGGAGEYYEVFAARDPLLTSEVTRRIEASKKDGDAVSGLL